MKKIVLIYVLMIVKISFATTNFEPKFTSFTFKQNIASEKNSTINTISFNSENKKFNLLINLLSVSFIAILSLLCLALYKNNVIKFKSNKLLEEKNKELEIEKQNVESAIKSRDEFLATISHELKTPLNSINIISELLYDENPKKSQLENLISLKVSANYLMNLINDVLQINQIESSTYNIEETEFNLHEKIYHIEKTMSEIAKLNNVTCLFNIDKNIPESITGDEVKISQILINLLTNAIKFSKDGIVTTYISLLEKNEDSIKIKFEVIDNGIGIPKNQQDLIFKIFTQASSEISRNFGGTGLGLSIVKKFVELLGGKINLYSEVGVGSNFNFELVFKNNISTLHIIKEENYSILEQKNILIVEDNTITQVITTKLLSKHKAICKIATTGKDALELIKENTFDMILMDINLPDMNGDVVTEEIRKFNQKIPIISFTAIHKKTCIEHLKEKGFNDFITKPVNTKLFYEKIISNLN